jgi:DNA (cytosine-5)-methyltransferase 1
MDRPFTYGTVCSGIGAPEYAFRKRNWRCAFMSEIDAFPRAVLTHHYAHVPLHGDFTTIQAGDYEPIDLLVGGTPCQSFSVAGLRKGLADHRGNLALEYILLADRLRPRWLVWENVPGVLSSNGGRDFGAILGGMVELGYGFAYRVLDAQFFGVAQRRRRVFVVGHLGDWRRAAAVLFERHSLQGHPAPRREAGKSAPTLPSRSSAGGGLGTDFDCDGGLIEAFGGNRTSGPVDVAAALAAHGGPHGRTDFASETFVVGALQSGATTRGHGVAGVNDQAVAFNITPSNSNKDYNARESDRAQAVTAGGNRPSARGGDLITGTGKSVYGVNHANSSQAGPHKALRALLQASGEEAFCEWGFGILAAFWPTEVLRSEVHGRRIRCAAFPQRGLVNVALSRSQAGSSWSVQDLWEAGSDGRSPQGWQPHEQLARQLGAYLSELPYSPSPAERFLHDLWGASEGARLLREALSALQEARRSTCGEAQSASGGSAVRRLTVEECEALQGFPRSYTLIPWRSGMAPDGPRYKALGNSMAVPVVEDIGEMIAIVDAL